jgi:hypothetical protein
MFPNIIKRSLIVGLLLLFGCSSTPVNIKGTVIKTDKIPIVDWESRTFFQVWLCPKKVDLINRIKTDSVPIAQSVAKRIAEKECIKGVTDDKTTYNFESIPQGRYTLSSTINIRNHLTWNFDGYWWVFDARIDKDKQIDLLIEEAYFFSN